MRERQPSLRAIADDVGPRHLHIDVAATSCNARTDTRVVAAMGVTMAITSRIRYAGLAGAAVLSVIAALAVTPMPAYAASVPTVLVGYADNLRANPTNFPTPWSGSPGVTFIGNADA